MIKTQRLKNFQFGLFASKEENESHAKAFEQGLILPVNPLQEKQAIETPSLSQFEFEIMEYTLKGLTIEEIALKINRTIAAAKWRLSHVYAKFGVDSRLQLIHKASKDGLQFFTTEYIKETKEYIKTKQTFHINLDMMSHNKGNK